MEILMNADRERIVSCSGTRYIALREARSLRSIGSLAEIIAVGMPGGGAVSGWFGETVATIHIRTEG
jgi:hypothetical protein